MSGVIVSEDKLWYLTSVEISLESTCAFGLKHFDTNMYLFVLHTSCERVCSDIQGGLYLTEVK